MAGGNRAFEDAARVAGGAFGTLAGLRREAEGIVRHQIDRILSGMDLVTRDEFEAVREMAAKARLENDQLESRLAALEAKAARPGRKKTSGAGAGRSKTKAGGTDDKKS
jgi:BMFP domain-containing protein YqiC